MLAFTLLSCSNSENKRRPNPLQMTEIKSGLLATRQPFNPIIVLKLKNVSDYEYNQSTFVKAIFIYNGQEIGSETKHFDIISSGITKQIELNCYQYGFNVHGGMKDVIVEANVYYNDQLIEKIKFDCSEENWLVPNGNDYVTMKEFESKIFGH